MENSEDFVVVDESSTSEKQTEVERLRVLVELFTKALDSLNQSNVLLKNELQSALSVTLQHVCPDRTSSTDDLVKMLDSNITSPEEVRANYVKRLCSRLVALNDEKMELLAENTSLREVLSVKEREFNEQVADASLTTQNIEMVLRQLENGETDITHITPTSLSMIDLCASLKGILERLSNIRLKLNTENGTKAAAQLAGASDQVANIPRTTQSVAVSVRETEFISRAQQLHDRSSSPVNLESLNIETTERIDPQSHNQDQDDDLSEFGLHNAPQTESVPEMVSSSYTEQSGAEGAGRGTPQPSYSASQEDPWCPCCYQRFGSRDELETHFLSCLS